MAPEAAHDAYRALLIKAPERCEMLGISRDRVLKRFEDWADNATREVPLIFAGSWQGSRRTDAPPEGNAERLADERPMTYRKHCLDCLHCIETARPRFVLPKWLRAQSMFEVINEGTGW